MIFVKNQVERQVKQKRSVEQTLNSLEELAANSASLLAKPFGSFESGGREYSLPRYLFVGPRGGDDPIRVGIFAGLHGDQPEATHAVVAFLKILEANPELARDYFLFVYPICNPTGFEDGTRCSRRGRDLNREFWNATVEPEVTLLQSEIWSHALDGIISLHTDESSSGLYGFTRGLTFRKHLLEPALAAAEPVLPRNEEGIIDGFVAQRGAIRESYAGAISGPPKVRPRPFEIALCGPGSAPTFRLEQGFVLAMQAILARYRELRAYAAHL